MDKRENLISYTQYRLTMKMVEHKRILHLIYSQTNMQNNTDLTDSKQIKPKIHIKVKAKKKVTFPKKPTKQNTQNKPIQMAKAIFKQKRMAFTRLRITCRKIYL